MSIVCFSVTDIVVVNLPCSYLFYACGGESDDNYFDVCMAAGGPA